MRRALVSAAALLALVACDDDNKPPTEERIRIYSSMEECVADKGQEACSSGWDKATEEHRKTAPRYTDRSACESTYGRCEARKNESGTDVFLPLMAGFMLGNALGNSGPRYTPVYIDRGNTAYLGNQSIGSYRDCRNTNCGGSSGGYIGSAGYSNNTGVWSSGSYSTTRYSSPASSIGGSKPFTAPSTTARGGFGASASSAATSSGG